MESPRTIWKYPLAMTGSQFLTVPRFHSLLTVQLQNGSPCLWAEVNPSSVTLEIEILCFSTGGPGPRPDHKYIATIQIGEYVWHFYVREAV